MWILLILFTHGVDPVHATPFLITNTQAQCKFEAKTQLDRMINAKKQSADPTWGDVTTKCVTKAQYNKALVALGVPAQ